jgi:hypothetical protein
MSVPFHVGDVGAIIRLTVFEDGAAKNLSAASSKQIKIYKPDGTVLTKTAEFYTTGADGKLQCTTETGDFDAPGLYSVVAAFTVGGWSGHSTPATIQCRAVSQ